MFPRYTLDLGIALVEFIEGERGVLCGPSNLAIVAAGTLARSALRGPCRGQH